MKRSVVIAWLLLTGIAGQAQIPDSLWRQWRTADPGPEKRAIADKVLTRCATDTACLLTTLSDLRPGGSPVQVATAAHDASRRLNAGQQFPAAFRLNTAGLGLAPPDSAIYGSLLAQRASLLSSMGRRDSIQPLLFAAIELLDATDPKNAWSAYYQLFLEYQRLDQPERALAMIERAYERVRLHHRRADRGMVLFELVRYALRVGAGEVYLAYYPAFAEFYDNVEGDPMHRALFDMLFERDSSIAQLEEILRQQPDSTQFLAFAKSHLAVGDFYRKRNAFAPAETNYLRAIDYLERKALPQYLRQATYALYELYREHDRVDRALPTLEKYLELNETFNQQHYLDRISELEVEYKTAQTAAELEARSWELERTRRRIQLLAGGVGGLLLVGVLLVGFWFSLRKQKIALARSNAQLERTLLEKEDLLREIHHRVKNNLQIVSSLLRLQARQLDDDRAVAAMAAGQSRVEAMSLVHRFLYQDTEVRKVNLKAYLEQLVGYLRSIYDDPDQPRTVDLELNSIDLDVDTMVPLGLILNELLTNAFKYANTETGAVDRISVRVDRQAEELWLEVRDNGAGFPAAILRGEQRSFGFRLIDSFVRKLGAALELGNEAGAWVRMRIPLPQLSTV